jgi:hypothetical protein
MRQSEERSEAEPAPERTEARPSADPVQRVLALQRTIGNRAVGAILARDSLPTDTKSPATGAELSVTLDGLGPIPLTSLQFAMSRPSGHVGSGGSKSPRGTSGVNANFTSTIGDHSTKLFQALLSGQVFKTVVIARGTMRITLTDAMLSTYSTSAEPDPDHGESWALNYVSIAYDVK